MNTLNKYGYTPISMDGFAPILENINTQVPTLMTKENLLKCFSYMDLTTLSTDDTPTKVKALVEKTNNFSAQFPNYPLPASICVYSNLANAVKTSRLSEELAITVVSACFPTSQSFLEVKLLECELAVKEGAEEIDIVLALNSFCEGNYEVAKNEILQIRNHIDAAASKYSKNNVVLKVILETGLLVDSEKIAQASFLAMEAGADFIKTSTGKVSVNATPEAFWTMCECVKTYHQATGKKVGVKAAGGISTSEDAIKYFAIIKEVLGEEWLSPSLFRLGVSRLANSIVSSIEGRDCKFF